MFCWGDDHSSHETEKKILWENLPGPSCSCLFSFTMFLSTRAIYLLFEKQSEREKSSVYWPILQMSQKSAIKGGPCQTPNRGPASGPLWVWETQVVVLSSRGNWIRSIRSGTQTDPRLQGLLAWRWQLNQLCHNAGPLILLPSFLKQSGLGTHWWLNLEDIL